MPDATNHLEAFNLIAKAIEDKVAQINVAPTTVNIDLSGVIEAIKGIKLECNCSSGGSTGGGTTTTPDITKLVEVVNQLVCVVVPIANSQHQIEKELAYWTIDGPQYGLDAPPGTFIFPDPRDTAPPGTYTPDPPTPTDPETGAWVYPPIVNGRYFVTPPGGMGGVTNAQAYDNYKCDAAAFIWRLSRTWFDSMERALNGIDKLDDALAILLVAINVANEYLIALDSSLRLAAIASNTMIDAAEFTGVNIIKGAAKTTVIKICSKPKALAIITILTSVPILISLIHDYTQQYLAVFDHNKSDLLCALWKAKTVGEARANFMEVMNRPENATQMSFWYGQILSMWLSDELLTHLFACSPNFDPGDILGMGAAEGGCAACVLCKDMDITLAVNLTSEANYYNLPDKTGLVPYPISYEITLHQVLAVCVTLTSLNQVTGGGSNVPTATCRILKDGVQVAASGVKVGVGIAQEILLPCPVVSLWDKTPVPFDGNYTITLDCAGTVGNKPRFTLETVSYKEQETQP